MNYELADPKRTDCKTFVACKVCLEPLSEFSKSIINSKPDTSEITFTCTCCGERYLFGRK